MPEDHQDLFDQFIDATEAVISTTSETGRSDQERYDELDAWAKEYAQKNNLVLPDRVTKD